MLQPFGRAIVVAWTGLSHLLHVAGASFRGELIMISADGDEPTSVADAV